MSYDFSDRISSLKPSAIREIFKALADPEMISFAGGNPAPETFPVDIMASIAAGLFEKQSAGALQYGITEGYPRLRELVAARLKNKYGIGRDFDDTIIVTGGQQGIDLATKVLINEGDTVLCEQPAFIGALNAFRSYKANLVGVPVDAEGMNMQALERALQENPGAKFIYLVPTFQNPSGVTLSLARRKKVLELSEAYNVLILEDNPYFELRYSGQYVPPIKSMDEKGRVIYVGSFSKVISPGMRVGMVCAPAEIISKLVVAKQVSDVHTNQFFMMLVAQLLESYDLDAHIEKVCALYRSKRDHMLAAMQRHLAGKAHWNVPDGGLFIWMELPEGRDGTELCRLMTANKVAAVPGAAFMPDEHAVSPGLRLNFSLPALEQIDAGVEIMGRCLDQYLK